MNFDGQAIVNNFFIVNNFVSFKGTSEVYNNIAITRNFVQNNSDASSSYCYYYYNIDNQQKDFRPVYFDIISDKYKHQENDLKCHIFDNINVLNIKAKVVFSTIKLIKQKWETNLNCTTHYIVNDKCNYKAYFTFTYFDNIFLNKTYGKYFYQQVRTDIVQRTYENINIIPQAFTVPIIDNSNVFMEKKFEGASVNIIDKTEIIIPIINDYGEFSIVLQKQRFVELILPKDAIEITPVPEGLVYEGNSLKGTFTKSGTYNLTIKYKNGEQLINIIVPYYERLL